MLCAPTRHVDLGTSSSRRRVTDCSRLWSSVEAEAFLPAILLSDWCEPAACCIETHRVAWSWLSFVRQLPFAFKVSNDCVQQNERMNVLVRNIMRLIPVEGAFRGKDEDELSLL